MESLTAAVLLRSGTGRPAARPLFAGRLGTGRCRMSRRTYLYLVGLLSSVVLLLAAGTGSAQVVGQQVQQPQFQPMQVVGGVFIDIDGTVRYREADAAAEAALLRAKAVARSPAKDSAVRFVSLPRLVAEAAALARAGRPLPDRVRFMGGLTQVRYVLVYPEEKDLIIGGPGEDIDRDNMPRIGPRTGRPFLQFDDFIVAMRSARRHGRPLAFGCSIDPDPQAMQRSVEALRQHMTRPRNEILAAVHQAVGPQRVTVFGVPPDTRVSLVCLAADYKLKRLSLGIDPPPLQGLTHAIDNTRVAGNRFWFEALYEPLLVSRDGNAIEIRGQRLQVKAGALMFDERGATATAVNFARQFTQHMPALAAAVPVFAELQNVADLSLVASMIVSDRLDAKIGWDTSPILDAGVLPVAVVHLPRSAETLVCIRSGSVAAGGVSLNLAGVLDARARKADEAEELAPVRREGRRAAEPTGSRQ